MELGKRQASHFNFIDLIMAITLIITISFRDFSRVRMIVQSGCVIVIGLYAIRENKKLPQFLLWGLQFTLICATSFFWARTVQTWLSCTISVFQVILIGTAIIIYSNSTEKHELLLKILFISAIFLCLRLILVVPISAWGTERVGNYIGYGNNGISIALSYVAIFTLYIGQIKGRKVYYIFTVLFLGFSMMSGSRKGLMIAVLGISMLVVFQSKNTAQTIKSTFLAAIISIVLVMIVMTNDFLYQVLGKRISSLIANLSGEKGDASTRDRLYFIELGWKIFLNNPVLGVGIDGFRYINPLFTYSHNNYIEMLSNLGIIGAISYYSFPIATLCKVVKAYRKEKNDAQCLLIVILTLILITDLGLVSYSQETVYVILSVALSGCKLNSIPNNGGRKICLN